MLERFLKMYREKQEIALLEVAYTTASIIAFLAAAILALFNQALGLAVLVVPLIMIVALVMNIVAWALVRFIADDLEKHSKAKKSPANKK